MGFPAAQPSPITGILQEPLLYAYNKGLEHFGGWVEGYTYNRFDRYKTNNHLYLEAERVGAIGGESTWVTENLVDLTNVDTLYIDWEASGVGHQHNFLFFIASTNKTTNRQTFDASLSVSLTALPRQRGVNELDVSNLSGNYYIRVHCFDYTLETTTSIKVYRIWGVGTKIEPDPPLLYKYNMGLEPVDWEEGYSDGTGSQSKESDHLYLLAEQADGGAERAYVTNTLVDLTNINTLYIDWVNTGLASGGNVSYLIASVEKNLWAGDWNARIQKFNVFARKIDSLDVSALAGNYYLRVHARDTTVDAARKSEIKVYRLWGEA